ncbi:gustatory receptor [Homalodisca vitripennis]|nr:gustatory receptor [Homalodisca vitripennis]
MRIWTVLRNIRAASFFWANLPTTVSVITAVVSLLSTSLCIFVCLWLAIFRIEQKIAILEKLREIDFVLHKEGPYKTRIISYLVIIHIVICILCSLKFFYNILSYDSIAQLGKVIITCALLEFLELTLSIRDNFQLVNKRVLEVVKLDQYKRSIWDSTLPCIETIAAPRQHTLSIPRLNEIHWSICSVVHDLSDTYGPYLISMVVFLFTHLIFNPYNLFLQYNMSHVYYTPSMVLTASWIILYCCQLYLLLTPCSMAVSEARRSTTVISHLMSHQIDNRLYQQLDTFAQQLLHRQVEFSASGLFTLQTPVVISVASTVTTYLAIIIQFQGFPVQETEVLVNLNKGVPPPAYFDCRGLFRAGLPFFQDDFEM